MKLISNLKLLVLTNFSTLMSFWIVNSFSFMPLTYFIRASVDQSREYALPELPHFYKKYSEYSLQSLSLYSPLLYAPPNNFTNSVIQEIKNMNKYKIDTESYQTEDELLNAFYKVNISRPVCGLVFEDLDENGSVPDHLKYKLRISNTNFETLSLFKETFPGKGDYNEQYTSYFLPLQLMVDKAFIKLTENISNILPYKINIQQLPHPGYVKGFTTFPAEGMTLLIILSCLTKGVHFMVTGVKERNSGMKEMMTMLGVNFWLYWAGWMTLYSIQNAVTVSIMELVLMIRYGDFAVIDKSDWFLVWLFLFLYYNASTTFYFTISCLFKNHNVAWSAGIIISLITYSPVFILSLSGRYIGNGMKLLLFLLPNIPLSYGFHLIMDLETKRVGLSWGDLFKSSASAEGISFALVLIMLIVEIIVYSLIAWYLDNVMPGKHGVPKVWYFMLMPTYWFRRRIKTLKAMERDEMINQTLCNQKAHIKIRNLYKEYISKAGIRKMVLDGIKMDIYNGEIIALFGCRGAGKTTLMSILTGQVKPTEGTVYIDECDVQDDFGKTKTTMGVCPFHNFLLPHLTVCQHIGLFLQLRDLTTYDDDLEFKEAINALKLSEIISINPQISALPEVLKKKLSILLALLGHTKILLLDEPTSGVEPKFRREIWAALQKFRGERTILFTTESMEEATSLADKVAVLDCGKIQCYGTPTFLQDMFGIGYTLNLLKGESCDVSQISSQIQDVIPEARREDNDSVLSFLLPPKESIRFSELFGNLEKDKQLLGIENIGLSFTSLEDFFSGWWTGRKSEEQHDMIQNSEIRDNYEMLNEYSEVKENDKNVGMDLIFQQSVALLRKRLLFFSRNWKLYTLQACIAILLTLLVLVLCAREHSSEPKPLILNLDLYGPTEVLYSSSNTTFNYVYQKIIRTTESVTQEVSNIRKHIVKYEKDNLYKTLTNKIIATEFEFDGTGWNLNAMYSSYALHSAPISLNILTNTILQLYNSKKQISIKNHPFEGKQKEAEDLSINMDFWLLFCTLAPCGLMILTACFVKFPLLERVSKAKQLQLMTGVSPVLYWLSNFVIDLFFYLLVATVMVLLLFFIDPMDIFSAEELGVLLVLFLMYGASSIPFMYLFSYYKKSKAEAFSLVSIIVGVAMGTGFNVSWYIFKFTRFALEFIPHFTMVCALQRFILQAYSNNVCRIHAINCNIHSTNDCCRPSCKDGRCSDQHQSYYSFSSRKNQNGIGVELLYFGIDAMLYFCILVLLHYRHKKPKNVTLEGVELEEDVTAEKMKIEKLLEETTTCDGLLVYNATKVFKEQKKNKGKASKEKVKYVSAMKGISFRVTSGECFGLLGIRDSGKTTTLQTLIGDEQFSKGNARIHGYEITNNPKEFLSQIGYCPQHSAAIEVLTGREMITLFANLRGIPVSRINSEINKWISLLGLKDCENQLCETYSSQNKCMLNIAVALIGDPPVVLLDDPLTGADLTARQNLLNVLTKLKKSGQTVVLTSHSMQECEALCTHVAVIADGQFKCMGEVQHLREKFAQGVTIIFKMSVSGVNQHVMDTFLHDIEDNCKFGSPYLIAERGLLQIHYCVKDPNVSWKFIFTSLERIKLNYRIVEEYTICKTSLNHVFLWLSNGKPKTKKTLDG